MKKTVYILSVLSIVAFSLMTVSCNKNESLEPSHLLYFGLNAPHARIGAIPFTINQITGEITNDDPVPGNVQLSKVQPFFVTNDGKGEVTVGGVAQTSGVSSQDFTKPVEYVVTSGGRTVKYTVKITQAEKVKTHLGVVLQKKSPAIIQEIVEEKQSWIADGARYTEIKFTWINLQKFLFNLFVIHNFVVVKL